MKLSLNHQQTYILSLSGGVDSMSLFHYLYTHKFKFVVVHFNHQKRDSAINDHLLIESLCQKNNVPYHYIKLSIKSNNFQSVARDKRYRHLEKVAEKYDTKYILTAHHLDDQLETILMKMLRGSNLKGYAGMSYETHKHGYIYLKPFLNYTKDSLIAYAHLNDIPFNEDESNASDDYLRNRIRHHVLPLLKQENNVYKRFKAYSNQLASAFDYIRQQTLSFLKGKQNFSVSEFNQLDQVIQMDVLSYLLETYELSKSEQTLKNILKQIKSLKPNIIISLNKDYELIKSYDTISINLKKINSKSDFSNLLHISTKKDVNADLYIELCYNELDFPLFIRHRQNGDVLSFPYGHKKLKDFLIEKKIPLKERDQLLLVCDQKQNIVWIPDLYVNQTLGHKHQIYLSMKEKPHA